MRRDFNPTSGQRAVDEKGEFHDFEELESRPTTTPRRPVDDDEDPSNG
jgi:hypothetical protein